MLYIQKIIMSNNKYRLRECFATIVDQKFVDKLIKYDKSIHDLNKNHIGKLLAHTDKVISIIQLSMNMIVTLKNDC